MDYKIVALFDFDGVIANTIPALYEAYECFLLKHNKVPTKEDFESINGPHLNDVVQILKKKHALKIALNVLYQDYSSLVNLKLKMLFLFKE